MWPSLGFLIYLTIFETVFHHVKCKSKITTKIFEPVTTTTSPPVTHTSTRRYNVPVIQWVSINRTVEDTTTVKARAETVPAASTTLADLKVTTDSTNTNRSTTTEIPIEIESSNTIASRNEYDNRLKLNVSLRTWGPVEQAVLSSVPITTTPRSTSTDFNFLYLKNDDDKYEKADDCNYYKATDIKFDKYKMQDIWQTAYYQLTDKVQCFRIYIKKITDDERRKYQYTYGTFENQVNWDKIYLEIKALTYNGRKHFLQSSNKENGVLRNVIITEESAGHILHEESADQWLVLQKLLLMRDCDSGGIVVFSKVPYVPLQLDIGEALQEFGEEYGNGTPACDDDDAVNRYYEAEDEDVEKF